MLRGIIGWCESGGDLLGGEAEEAIAEAKKRKKKKKIKGELVKEKRALIP
jgi:hypothetical protein